MARTVVVAGAGLAGLVAAGRLAERGFDVEVYEREPAVGGRVRTRRRDGYVLDRGFQVLFTAYPAVRRELDLGALDLRRFTPGAVIARPGERSVLADPLRDPGALTESLFNREVRLGDKLRTLRLRRRLRKASHDALFEGGDATIEASLRDRGFSDRFLGSFAAPFYGGITLDRSLSTSKRVFEYTFKALSEGAIAIPARGMAAIPEQLAERARQAGATVHTDAPVERVEADEDGAAAITDEASLEADAAVVAAGPAGGEELLGVELPGETKGCVTQYYALEGEPLGSGRRLLLNAESGEPNHVVPHSEIAPEHAPEGTEMISATFLGEREEDDGELADRTREALASWYPERRIELEVVHTARVSRAQFAQPPGFRDALPDVRDPGGRAYLAGDVTEWSSIQGAMESGRRAAAAVAADLG